MSVTVNRAAFRRYYEEAVNKGNLDVVDELVDRDMVFHRPNHGDGPDGMREHIASLKRAFPDFTMTAEDIVAEGDKVVGRFTITGTHGGHLGDAPATGRPFRFEGMAIVRFRDGRMVDVWTVLDHLSFQQQLGLIPATAGGTAASPGTASE